MKTVNFSDLIVDRTKEGVKLPTNEYKTTGRTAIIDQGQAYIAGYTDKTDGFFFDVPAIIFGDHTRVFKYVDFPFFLGADGVKILKANQEVSYKYLFHYFLQAKFPNTGYARHFKWLKDLKIPLPPLATQKHIGRAGQMHRGHQKAQAHARKIRHAREVAVCGDVWRPSSQ